MMIILKIQVYNRQLMNLTKIKNVNLKLYIIIEHLFGKILNNLNLFYFNIKINHFFKLKFFQNFKFNINKYIKLNSILLISIFLKNFHLYIIK